MVLGLLNISLELEWHNEVWCYVKLAFNPLSFMTLGLALNTPGGFHFYSPGSQSPDSNKECRYCWKV